MQSIGAIDSAPISEEDSKKFCEVLIAEMDKNGDGKIQWSELVSAAIEPMGFADEASMAEDFNKKEMGEVQYKGILDELKKLCGK